MNWRLVLLALLGGVPGLLLGLLLWGGPTTRRALVIGGVGLVVLGFLPFLAGGATQAVVGAQSSLPIAVFIATAAVILLGLVLTTVAVLRGRRAQGPSPAAPDRGRPGAEAGHGEGESPVVIVRGRVDREKADELEELLRDVAETFSLRRLLVHIAPGPTSGVVTDRGVLLRVPRTSARLVLDALEQAMRQGRFQMAPTPSRRGARRSGENGKEDGPLPRHWGQAHGPAGQRADQRPGPDEVAAALRGRE